MNAKTSVRDAKSESIQPSVASSPHLLPKLPYDFSALEPYIDVRTMRLHHSQHHATYVEKLNATLAPYPDLQERSAEWLLLNGSLLPEKIRSDVLHNAGGHVNHSLFWTVMSPRDGKGPTGALAAAIDQAFGDFDNFKKIFAETGAKLFGSGWVWLVEVPGQSATSRKLEIVTTSGHENPLRQRKFPLLLNDVWEHAYYLKYESKRAEYLKQWWNVVNWPAVLQRFERKDAAAQFAAGDGSSAQSRS